MFLALVIKLIGTWYYMLSNLDDLFLNQCTVEWHVIPVLFLWKANLLINRKKWIKGFSTSCLRWSSFSIEAILPWQSSELIRIITLFTTSKEEKKFSRNLVLFFSLCHMLIYWAHYKFSVCLLSSIILFGTMKHSTSPRFVFEETE